MAAIFFYDSACLSSSFWIETRAFTALVDIVSYVFYLNEIFVVQEFGIYSDVKSM